MSEESKAGLDSSANGAAGAGSNQPIPSPAKPEIAAQKPSSAPSEHKRPVRKIVVGLLLAVLLVLAGLYFFRAASPYRTTDDAYVHGNQVYLAPLVGGTVVSITADDTDLVRRGQPVVILDDSDARVALQQAEATLDDTMRKVRQFYDNVSQFEANVDARKTDLSRAENDYQRRTAVRNGSVSAEEITHAQDGLNAARAALKAAEQQLAAARALVAGTDLEHHPMVLQAEAQVLAASLAEQRTTVCAPETGYIARRNVQIGQRVAPGTPLLTIIPLDQVWVDANFKEEQLKDVRIGQSVTLIADFYGSSVKFDGHVAGLGSGTGAAFALLPPQEASGNWIKIVQRVPVRILVDPKQLIKYPLRLGLTMTATIDTQNRNGLVLAQTPSTNSIYDTQIYAGQYARASELVQQLVGTNLQALATFQNWKSAELTKSQP
jgi:membrane fusion protein, multidrug efflux system